MPQPIVNPDGTVQVAPPRISAFSPQASASAPPPPPMQPTAVRSQGTPDQGAIYNLVNMLTQLFAPQSITQRGPKLKEQQQQAEGLGNAFHQGQ